MQHLTEAELKIQAKALANNALLRVILDTRVEDLKETWERSGKIEEREHCWEAVRQVRELDGAIDNAIREHGGYD